MRYAIEEPQSCYRPGLEAITDQIAVLRIPLQQSLPLEISADAQGEGLG